MSVKQRLKAEREVTAGKWKLRLSNIDADALISLIEAVEEEEECSLRVFKALKAVTD